MKYSPSLYAVAFLAVAEKKGVTREVVGNLLGTLKKNGDLSRLSEVLRFVERFFYKKNGIAKVEVTTAREAKKEFESELHECFGKKAEISFAVQPEIIGGTIIKINDETLIDASVKRRIDKLFRI